ncbi:hypothetical protein JTB14_019061 [Gonioctena quinquepunctata]|nr:hypothetical protein JTB14_019061 [Gonioctena quinquepunctata]
MSPQEFEALFRTKENNLTSEANFSKKAQVDLVPGAADTGEVVLFFDELFDSLNSSQKTAPASKPLKGGLMKESGHEKFWRDALEILKNMKFFSKHPQ